MRKFVANEHFKVDLSDEAPIRISEIDEGFHQYFLEGEGLVEMDVPSREIVIRDIGRESCDHRLWKVVHGDDQIAMAHLWQLLRVQPKLEPGFLNTTSANGNYFFIYLLMKGQWVTAVVAPWGEDSWRLAAYPAEFCPVDKGTSILSAIPEYRD